MNIFLAMFGFLFTGCVFDTTTFHLSDSKAKAQKDGLLIATYTPFSNIDSLILTEAWVQKGYFNNKDGSREIVDVYDLCFNIASNSSVFFNHQNFNRDNGFDIGQVGLTKGVYNYNIDNQSLPDTVVLQVYRVQAGQEKIEIGSITFVKDK